MRNTNSKDRGGWAGDTHLSSLPAINEEDEMIVTLCGANSYEVEQQRKAVEDDFIKQHGPDSIIRLAGENTDINELRGAVQSTNLFALSTMVILSGPSLNKNLFMALEGLLESVPDSTTLVVVDGILDKRTRIFKLLQTKTDFREYNLLDENAAGRWVVKGAMERGGSITPQVARLLVERVGADQWQLTQELEKLVAFNKVISKESIEVLVVPNLEARLFEVLDAVFSHNEERSRRMVAELRAVADPYELFGLLVWQIHALALVVSAANEKNDGSIASRTGLKPFVTQKLQTLKVTPKAVKTLADQVADLDIRLKSGVEPWLVIEQTLLKIAYDSAG
ncbi:MAG TPA: DNA polymerase III subunit delta [Candidatus Saccharimonadales bacterium]|nr:DNA polymerase III subunit delta [Candidatus Saccharimonadales bacterium]